MPFSPGEKKEMEKWNKFEIQLDLLLLPSPFIQRMKFYFSLQTVQSAVVWTIPEVLLYHLLIVNKLFCSISNAPNSE